MPQMSPMWWTFLMVFFTLSMLLFLVKIAFITNLMKKNNQNKTSTNMYWKW